MGPNETIRLSLKSIEDNYPGATIIAVDPGISSGICVYDQGTVSTKTLSIVEFYDFLNTSVMIMIKTRPVIIVMEDFILYPKMATSMGMNKLDVCRLCGVVEYFTHTNSVTLHKLFASGIKFNRKVYNDLRKIISSGTNTTHELDASLHLIMFGLKHFGQTSGDLGTSQSPEV